MKSVLMDGIKLTVPTEISPHRASRRHAKYTDVNHTAPVDLQVKAGTVGESCEI